MSRFCTGFLERFYESDECLALLARERRIRVSRALRFAAMPENCFFDGARAAVVEEVHVAAHRTGEAYAPQRRRAPLATIGIAFRPVVCEALAHVVQQQIGIGPDFLMREMRLACDLAGLVRGRV